jgi:hypothetical protein
MSKGLNWEKANRQEKTRGLEMPLWREEVLNRAADRLIAQFTQPALPPVKTGKMTEKAKRRMQKRLQKRRQKRSTT